MIIYTVNVYASCAGPLVPVSVTLCINKGLARKWAVRYLRDNYGNDCAHLSDTSLLRKPDLGFVKITFGSQRVITQL
jgi:hypothetical protein